MGPTKQKGKITYTIRHDPNCSAAYYRVEIHVRDKVTLILSPVFNTKEEAERYASDFISKM